MKTKNRNGKWGLFIYSPNGFKYLQLKWSKLEYEPLWEFESLSCVEAYIFVINVIKIWIFSDITHK